MERDPRPDDPANVIHHRRVVDLTDGTVVGVDAVGAGGPLGLLAAASEWVDRARSTGEPVPDIFLTPDPELWFRADAAEVLAHVLTAAGLEVAHAVITLWAPGPDLASVDRLSATLDELTATGVRVALGGFGRSSASLGWLRELPLTIVRVDARLLSGADHDDRVVRMLGHLAELTRDLDLDAIVEGVDGDAAADLVRVAGFRFGVGEHVGPWQSIATIDLAPRPSIDVDLSAEPAEGATNPFVG